MKRGCFWDVLRRRDYDGACDLKIKNKGDVVGGQFMVHFFVTLHVTMVLLSTASPVSWTLDYRDYRCRL